MRRFLLALLLVMNLGLAGVAEAQIGIYGAFTAGKLDTVNNPWLYGGTLGLYLDRGHGLIATGFDARGEFLHKGGDSGSASETKLTSGLAGVRLAITPHVLPLKPYAEGLIGVGIADFGLGSSSTSFQYKVLGGLDVTFFPRLDWRVVEFGYGGLTNNPLGVHPMTLSTGLVLRLPY